ncbi:MAG: FG-GAP repeat protein [Thermoanaerobaculia bacterium]
MLVKLRFQGTFSSFRRGTLSALVLAAAMPLAPAPSRALDGELGPAGTQFWTQSSAGLGIGPQSGAGFGAALAAGDFNCDGFDDLAIGMPGDDLVGAAAGGRVLVLFSGVLGPVAIDRQIWSQNSPVIEDDGEPNDRFGSVLVAGDFNDDGCGDLAVGVPSEGIGSDADAGAVHVIYGSADGLTGDDDDFFYQGLASINGVGEAGDRFGGALAAGDFDGDGIDDLAIGSPGEDIEADSVTDAGAVHVLFGSASGIVTAGQVLFYRGAGLTGSPQDDEQIGAVLVAGEFNPLTAGEELAIGVPHHDLGALDQAGAVLLVADIDGALFDALYTEDTTGVPGVAEGADRFGAVLAAGDFDGDGIDELAVGDPVEDLEGPFIGDVGSVTVLDFDGDPDTQWTQDDLNPEHSELGDHFGGALAAADFDADGIDDLAIGAPDESLGPVGQAGLLHVLYGTSGTGLDNDRDQIWLQTLDPSETGDGFAGALVAGHFSGHSGADLAIGAPGETDGAFSQVGATNLLFSEALFRDGFESGNISRWQANN